MQVKELQPKITLCPPEKEGSRFIYVPVEFCAKVAQLNLESPARVFLAAKLLFIHGKTQLTTSERKRLLKALNYDSPKSLKRNWDKLLNLGWVRLNEKTGFYILKGFHNIDGMTFYGSASCIALTFEALNEFDAFIGAAIYANLYRMNKRRAKLDNVNIYGINKRRAKLEKGRQPKHGQFDYISRFHFQELPSTHNNKNKKKVYFGNVAKKTLSVLYGISQSKAGRLRKAAYEANYIDMKFHVQKLNIDFKGQQKTVSKFRDRGTFIFYSKKDKSYYLQKPSLIYPLFTLKWRGQIWTQYITRI